MMAEWTRRTCSLLLLLVLLPSPAAAAGPEAAVRLAPAIVEVGAGLTTAVEVRVEGVQGLYGLDIRLAFDPAAVEVVDVDPAAAGVQVRHGDLLKLDLVARNAADNSAGTVWFAMTQANPTKEVSGSGTAFSVTFRGRREGALSALSVTYARLATRDGREIAAECQGGTIRVVGAALAPATPTLAPPPAVPALMLTASAPAPTQTAPAPLATPQGGPAPAQRASAAPGAALLAALVGGLAALGVDLWQRRRPRGPA